MDIPKLLTKTCISPNISNENFDVLEAVGNAIASYMKEEYPNLPSPIVAGGFVRDCLFGVEPQDIDIFLDTSKIPEEDREDTCLLIHHGILRRLGEGKYPIYRWCYSQQSDKKTYQKDGEDTKNFVLYTSEVNYAEEEPGDEPMPDDVAESWYSPIQLIGRPMEGLNDDPLGFIEKDFDYSLVKCFYDPTAASVIVSDEFLKSVEDKVVEAKDVKTYSRISSFRYRLYYLKEAVVGGGLDQWEVNSLDEKLDSFFRIEKVYKTGSVTIESRKFYFDELGKELSRADTNYFDLAVNLFANGDRQVRLIPQEDAVAIEGQN